jgi:hypothetical protein
MLRELALEVEPRAELSEGRHLGAAAAWSNEHHVLGDYLGAIALCAVGVLPARAPHRASPGSRAAHVAATGREALLRYA